ncbi:MAG: phenylalanine--tRNA ligase subunit beta [Gammaproteobacteria bacterium]|nr:phenylalanine--tRNA ligase subunit beta [Gammaproteobacteria bacterium]
MKLSEQWLREWVNPSITPEELRTKLTMAGLEVESLDPVAEPFSQVVVAEVIQVEKHPEADRLKVCQVNVGQPELLTIVCGASNVKPGIKVPAALVGAILPKLKITKSKLRGIVSNGMLCSEVELSLAEESNGLMILPQDAPVGKLVWDYLNLSDSVMDINITPNRGDCLSILGVATEVSALTETPLKKSPIHAVQPTISDTLSVTLETPTACPHYVGRIIREVDATIVSPMWLRESLRRSGVRSINAIVDVMNYVMLELGQPMHAFDLEKIKGGIYVKKAETTENITTLDGQTITIHPDILIIRDEQNPLALAGVMGGLESAVTSLTKHIFLESAYFTPSSIAPAVRQYKLTSESSYRFERGIDSTIQATAIERATELLLSIVGGKPGPIIDISSEEYLPKKKTILLRSARVKRLLGFIIPDKDIEKFLQRLGFSTEKTTEGWNVTIPLRRADITIEADLIEEVVRLYGYDHLPSRPFVAPLNILSRPETVLDLKTLRQCFTDLGYHEAITYSFVDKKLQQLLDPGQQPKELLNPITSEMNVMRTNLWPGLINTLLYNQNRQQLRIRLFETGLRFITQNDVLLQQKVLSGLATGSVTEEQWGIPARSMDFFDIKGDLQKIFKLTNDDKLIKFLPCDHPALHPGQSALIYRGEEYLGIFGSLHPEVMQFLELSQPVFVFECLLDVLQQRKKPQVSEISKFPEIRRDLAIFVDETVPAQQIRDTIQEVGGELLRNINVFDVYQGKGVAPHRKSIALALTLQHASRTLVDEEVAHVVLRIVDILKQKFAAELRG